MKKRSIFVIVACLLAVVIASSVGFAASKKYTIATVPKQVGIDWFNYMEQGVKQFAKDYGQDAFQTGPTISDAALQVQIIEDLIAQNVDAICVVPNSTEALEPVLKKAMDQGIVVVTHESAAQKNVHFDLEAFDNASFGVHLMDELAALMNEEGEYAVFVEFLTSKSHNEWIDAAVARQLESYPNMKLVTERLETGADITVTYNRTKELFKTYPNLKGIIGCGGHDTAGAGLAIDELGLQDSTFVVGTGLVATSGQYLLTGAVDLLSVWDPVDAGYAMNRLALMILEGEEIKDGIDLGVPGFNNVKVDGTVVYGEAWVDTTVENMDGRL